MFGFPGYHGSSSLRSMQSSSSRTSTYTQSTSTSSLPVTLSRSASVSCRRKEPPSKYHTVILFLFALVLFSIAPTFRLTARAHANYTSIRIENGGTGSSSEAPSPVLGNEFNKAKVTTISALSVHRISEILFELIHNQELASLAVYPCHKHIVILRSLSRLLNLESPQERVLIFCLDPSSARLAEAHRAIREEKYAFDIKFIREDLVKNQPPKANIFVSIDDKDTLEAVSLEGLVKSVKESGSQVAVVNASPNKNANLDLDGDHQGASFPLADHIQLIKPLEHGFVVVYDLLNMTEH